MAKKEEKEIERWVTMKGARIPIFKDGTIGGPKALRERLQKVIKDPDSDLPPEVRMANLLSKKGIHTEQEIADYLKSLTPARRSILAGQMGVTSRGDAKIKEISHRIYMVNHKEDKPEPKPEPTPEPKKEKSSAKTSKSDGFEYPEYKNIIGDKQDINIAEQFEKLQKGNLINPHYNEITDRKDKDYYKYHKNCALCSVAAVFQAHGYDVEAMPRDKNTWRGFETIMDYDLTNPDNFLMGGAKNSWDNFDITRRLRRKFMSGSLKSEDYERMPRGSKQAASAIIARSQKWGDGSIAELSVDWKNVVYTHSTLVINNGGDVYVWCPQSNRIIKGQEAIARYLSDTIASHTQLVRVDNASLKPGISAELEKMIKVRDTSISAQLDSGLKGIDWSKF